MHEPPPRQQVDHHSIVHSAFGTHDTAWGVRRRPDSQHCNVEHWGSCCCRAAVAGVFNLRVWSSIMRPHGPTWSSSAFHATSFTSEDGDSSRPSLSLPGASGSPPCTPHHSHSSICQHLSPTATSVPSSLPVPSARQLALRARLLHVTCWGGQCRDLLQCSILARRWMQSHAAQEANAACALPLQHQQGCAPPATLLHV
jgi:hypothetical protein